ncbi:MAG: ComEC family competence protein [Chlorobiaceae bacterium]|nr:ComEC family competence protein [Chlorobiaceae bacterium]
MKNIRKLRKAVRFSLAPYPALRLLFFVITGILAGVYLPFPLEGWIMLSLIFLFTLLGSLLYELIKKRGPFPLLITTISYTLFLFSTFALSSVSRMHYSPRNGLLQYSGHSVLLYGRVDGRPDTSENGTSWIMGVEEVFVNGRTIKLRDRAKVFMRSGRDAQRAIHYGDMIRVKGQLDLISGAANSGEYDPGRASRMKQVSVQLYCAGPWMVLHEGAPELGSFERFIVQPVYDYMMKSIDELIPAGEARQLAAGVLTGEKEYLPPELFEAFRITGTAHILAVSGLNVGLLVLAIHVCLQRLKVTTAGRWISFLIAAFILLVYSYVTGNTASVKRAAIMTVVLIGGETLGRKTFSMNSLALSDVLILLFDPLDLLTPGFLMTNSAVASILLFYPRFRILQERGGGVLRVTGRFFLGSFAVTLAAVLGVSPVIAYYFGTFSLIGLLANIPVVLFSTLLMYALVPMLFLHLFSGYAASLFAESAIFFAELTLKSATVFSRVPFASLPVRLELPQVFLYYLLLGGALFFFTRKAWSKVAISTLLGLNLLFWYSFLSSRPPVQPTLLTINLGRHLAALYSSGSSTVLIDAARSERERKRILQQLERNGFAAPQAVVQFYKPDSLVLRHPVSRHMLEGDSLLVLPSMLIMRPQEKVLKLWSRKNSLLVVSGSSRLQQAELYKADYVLLWVYRFAEKQQQEILSWLDYARPKRCVLIPGSFLSRADLAALQRFAALRPGLEVRSKTRQVVIR